MRFLMKANFDNIESLCESFREFELCLKEDELSEEKTKRLLKLLRQKRFTVSAVSYLSSLVNERAKLYELLKNISEAQKERLLLIIRMDLNRDIIKPFGSADNFLAESFKALGSSVLLGIEDVSAKEWNTAALPTEYRHTVKAVVSYEKNCCYNFDNIALIRLPDELSAEMISEARREIYEKASDVLIAPTVGDGKDSVDRFYGTVMKWSHIHSDFEDKLNGDAELIRFFELLYSAFSAAPDNTAELDSISVSLREIMKNSLPEFSLEPRIGLGSSDDEYDETEAYKILTHQTRLNNRILSVEELERLVSPDKTDYPLFQAQAYTCYMRYALLAKDILKRYGNAFRYLPETLRHYIFGDTLKQISYDGIVPAYNIPWFMKEMTLFHFGELKEGMTDKSFRTLEEAAQQFLYHTANHNDSDSYIPVSFSKYLGRCLCKYYKKPEEGHEFNFYVVRIPVNSVWENGETRPLQAYRDEFCGKDDNFCIDFSDFYNERNGKDASLKALFDKVAVRMDDYIVGSVYDGEVIFKAKPREDVIWAYQLEDEAIKRILAAYWLILNVESEESIIESIIEHFEKRGWAREADILGQVDFELEKENRPQTSSEHNAHKSFNANDMLDYYFGLNEERARNDIEWGENNA